MIRQEMSLENMKCDFCNGKATFIETRITNYLFFTHIKIKFCCDKHRIVADIGKEIGNRKW